VDAVAAALVCDLGLGEDAVGEYYLGKLAMNRKQFKDAGAHFKRAIELDPGLVDAKNGHAVNLAYNKQLDDAIAVAEQITVEHPDYGPAWFNLAWWYAMKKKDAASAVPCYEKARALGMPPERAIEKQLKKRQ
jgi:tetratricopeptide (TPR) repeat protein